MQLSFAPAALGLPHDPLDRFYTPPALAAVVCEWLLHHVRTPRRIVEPSVGAGAFVAAARRVWPTARIEGVDVDPDAAGLALCDSSRVGDWLTGPVDHADLVLGNPPFSGTDAIPHVRRALESASAVALILPWAPLGGVAAWDDLLDGDLLTPGTYRPTYACPISPRPWPANVRETALYVWEGWPGKGCAQARETVIRRLPRWRA